jgi:hypothetical protein
MNRILFTQADLSVISIVMSVGKLLPALQN